MAPLALLIETDVSGRLPLSRATSRGDQSGGTGHRKHGRRLCDRRVAGCGAGAKLPSFVCVDLVQASAIIARPNTARYSRCTSQEAARETSCFRSGVRDADFMQPRYCFVASRAQIIEHLEELVSSKRRVVFALKASYVHAHFGKLAQAERSGPRARPRARAVCGGLSHDRTDLTRGRMVALNRTTQANDRVRFGRHDGSCPEPDTNTCSDMRAVGARASHRRAGMTPPLLVARRDLP
jgi:hypothetical protein